MKATGIIRRIDDLGRIVIPREIRRSMGLREGDPIEFFLSDVFESEKGMVMVPYTVCLAHEIDSLKNRTLDSLNYASNNLYEEIKNTFNRLAELVSKAEEQEEE